MLTMLAVTTLALAAWMLHQHYRVMAALRRQELQQVRSNARIPAQLYRAPQAMRSDWTKADTYAGPVDTRVR